ncbi:unnamed protein product, partial [Discosporangium mesarthrocarpum]
GPLKDNGSGGRGHGRDWAEGGGCGRGGVQEGFFICDGGHGLEYPTAVRVQAGMGLREWPLLEGSCFSVGLSVICTHYTRPQTSAGTSGIVANSSKGLRDSAKDGAVAGKGAGAGRGEKVRITTELDARRSSAEEGNGRVRR